MITHREYTENQFKCRGTTHTYRVWRDKVVANKWYWEALGNGGTAITEWEACELARRWIRDGQ